MATHDTEPDAQSAVTEPHPGGEHPPTGLAADLLASLSDAPLPERGVAETKGHDAAQFAAGPHAPPRRATDYDAEPAVILETTPAPPPDVASFGRTEDPAPLNDDARTVVATPRKKTTRHAAAAVALVMVASVVVLGVASIPRPGPAKRVPGSSAPPFEAPEGARSSQLAVDPIPTADVPSDRASRALATAQLSATMAMPSAARLPKTPTPPSPAPRPPRARRSPRADAERPTAPPLPTTKYNQFLEEEKK